MSAKTARFDGDVVLLGKARKTPQGYLRLDARLARVGVQNYDGGERTEYRAPEEVFSSASLESYKHVAVTEDHPPVMLDETNTGRYAKGFTLEDARRDGDFVRASILVTDADLIAKMRKGKNQLSMGYHVDVEEDPGVAPDGTPYTHRQTNIRANHLSVVAKARAAGAVARVDSATPRKDKMATVRIDSTDYDLPEEVANHIARLEARHDAGITEVRFDAAEFGQAVRARAALERSAVEHGVRCDGLDDASLMHAVISKLSHNPIPKDRTTNLEYLKMRLDAELAARASNAVAEVRIAGDRASRVDYDAYSRRSDATLAATMARLGNAWKEPVAGEIHIDSGEVKTVSASDVARGRSSR